MTSNQILIVSATILGAAVAAFLWNIATKFLSQYEKIETWQFDTKLFGPPIKPGIIYIMRCDAHVANLYKVGYTTKSAEDRAYQLSKSTATPRPFKVIDAIEVQDVRYAEKVIHDELADYRLEKKREFFQAPLQLIQKRLRQRVQKGRIQ